jgi:hypothetical protein
MDWIAALGERDEALQCPACGEQERADKEGDPVRAIADELRITRERPDQKTRRAEREEQRHPPFPTHRRRSLPVGWEASVIPMR